MDQNTTCSDIDDFFSLGGNSNLQQSQCYNKKELLIYNLWIKMRENVTEKVQILQWGALERTLAYQEWWCVSPERPASAGIYGAPSL